MKVTRWVGWGECWCVMVEIALTDANNNRQQKIHCGLYQLLMCTQNLLRKRKIVMHLASQSAGLCFTLFLSSSSFVFSLPNRQYLYLYDGGRVPLMNFFWIFCVHHHSISMELCAYAYQVLPVKMTAILHIKTNRWFNSETHLFISLKRNDEINFDLTFVNVYNNLLLFLVFSSLIWMWLW